MSRVKVDRSEPVAATCKHPPTLLWADASGSVQSGTRHVFGAGGALSVWLLLEYGGSGGVVVSGCRHPSVCIQRWTEALSLPAAGRRARHLLQLMGC
jgi:hypothetical protein